MKKLGRKTPLLKNKQDTRTFATYKADKAENWNAYKAVQFSSPSNIYNPDLFTGRRKTVDEGPPPL